MPYWHIAPEQGGKRGDGENTTVESAASALAGGDESSEMDE